MIDTVYLDELKIIELIYELKVDFHVLSGFRVTTTFHTFVVILSLVFV